MVFKTAVPYAFWIRGRMLWLKCKICFPLFSAFVLRFSKFVSKSHKKSFLRANFFLSEKGQYVLKKHLRKKLQQDKKKCFSKKSPQKHFYGSDFFWLTFSDTFLLSEINIKFCIFYVHPYLTYFIKKKKFRSWKGLFCALFWKENTILQYKGWE